MRIFGFKSKCAALNNIRKGTVGKRYRPESTKTGLKNNSVCLPISSSQDVMQLNDLAGFSAYLKVSASFPYGYYTIQWILLNCRTFSKVNHSGRGLRQRDCSGFAPDSLLNGLRRHQIDRKVIIIFLITNK